MTLSEALKGKTIAAVYDRDDDVLIRLDDRTEIVIFDGIVREYDDTESVFYIGQEEEESF